MASRSCSLLSPSSRLHLHRRIPQLRQSPTPNRIRQRGFHSTPRPQYLEPVLSVTHEALQFIHSSASLPWCYSIPLAALSLRLVFLLPLAIRTRRLVQEQVRLNPLILARHNQIRKEVESQFLPSANAAASGPALEQAQVKASIATRKAVSKYQKSLFKRHGVQKWKAWVPVLGVQLPVFLVVSETLRRMCGQDSGLLGVLFGEKAKLPTGDGAAEAVGSAASASGLGVDGITERLGEAVASIPDPLAAVSAPIGLDPSLATEGMLWFPNLLVADAGVPGLSFVLSGVMFLNLMRIPQRLRGNAQVQESTQSQTRLQRYLRIGLRSLALSAGPLLYNVPTGLLLYWISTGIWGFFQMLLLEWAMPMPRAIKPCKRKVNIYQV